MYTDFEFDGRKLSDFGCIVANINSNNGYREIDIGSQISFNTVKNNHSSIHYVTSSKYDNTYSVSLQIIKNIPRNNYNNVYFSQLEFQELMKWLNRREYSKFKPIYTSVTDCDVHYYGSFNIVELKIDDKTIGFTATFNSNAPYGFGERIQYTTITSVPNEHLVLFGDSDEFISIYPDVTIKCLSDGDLKISNLNSDDENEYLYIKECSADEVITISNEHGVIQSNIRTDEQIANNFNYNFFEIEVNDYYCTNEYEISIPCELTISYEPIRKVGGY